MPPVLRLQGRAVAHRSAFVRRRQRVRCRCSAEPEAKLGRFDLIVSREIFVLPSVIGSEKVPGLVLFGAQPIPPCVMVIDIEAMRSIGLGDRTMVVDDRHVFIVVVRRRITEIVAAGYNDAVVGEWVDHHDLVVDDRVTGLVQFLFPLAEGVGRGDALGADHAVILGQRRIALVMLLRLVGAAAMNRRVELARCLRRGHRAAHEQAMAWPSTPRPPHRRCLVNRAGRRGTGPPACALAMMSNTSVKSGGLVSFGPCVLPRALVVFGENHKSTVPLPSSSAIAGMAFAFSSRNAAGLLRLAVLARRVGVGFEPLPVFLIGRPPAPANAQ